MSTLDQLFPALTIDTHAEGRQFVSSVWRSWRPGWQAHQGETMQGSVVVKQFPQSMLSHGVQKFFQELQPILRCSRPSLVFDFSQVCDFDSAGIEVLLRCLEEVMKQNGDLKLAAVTPRTKTILELTRIDRLFQVFSDPAEAVRSFACFPAEASLQSTTRWNSQPREKDSPALTNLSVVLEGRAQ